MKKCPFCAEEIQDEAIKCKHCGSFLNEQNSQIAPSQPAYQESGDSSQDRILSTTTDGHSRGQVIEMLESHSAQSNKKKGTSLWLMILIPSILIVSLLYIIKKSNTEPPPRTKKQTTLASTIPKDPVTLFAEADNEMKKGNPDRAINYYQILLRDFPQSEQAQAAQPLLAPAQEEKKKKDEEKRKKAEEEKLRREKASKRAQGLLWNYYQGQDDMTQGTIKSAYVKSINEVNFGFPYSGTQRATLTLRNHPRYGKDVILKLEKGQFLCGIYNCKVSARFDNGKSQNYTAVEPADHSTTMLFIRDYSRFVANIKKARKLYLEAQFYQEGPRVFEFDVEDLDFK